MFEDRDRLAPILLSMFLGLLAVALIGGFLLNSAKNKLSKSNQPTVTITKNEKQPSDSKNFWDSIKEKLFKKKPESTKADSAKSSVTPQNDNTAGASSVPESETQTYISYVNKSNLTELHEEKGESFTLLIPTNKAFDNARAALQQLEDKNDQTALQLLMKRHLIRGKVLGGTARTLSNEDVFIDFDQRTVSFDGIITRIIEVRGDSIIIDKVLY